MSESSPGFPAPCINFQNAFVLATDSIRAHTLRSF
jgi:hypothetical protein